MSLPILKLIHSDNLSRDSRNYTLLRHVKNINLSLKTLTGMSEYIQGLIYIKRWLKMVDKISNKRAKDYVKDRRPFLGNNLSADWSADEEYYVVFSYDKYPIYVYVDAIDTWYETDDSYSVTTAKHIAQTRPQVTTVIHRYTMEDIVKRGTIAVVRSRLAQEDEPHYKGRD